MQIVITDWALDSYLDLLQGGAFSRAEYWSILRPDVERLRSYPDDAMFGNHKFWSTASVRNNLIPDGFKMKWHNMGSGRTQLRLPVGIVTKAFLCAAYVKSNPNAETKALIRFEQHVDLIRKGQFVRRGSL
jgi:hypothetical protein